MGSELICCVWDRNWLVVLRESKVVCFLCEGSKYTMCVYRRAVNCLVFMYCSKLTWLYCGDRYLVGVWVQAVDGLFVVWGSVRWCFKIIRCIRFTEKRKSLGWVWCRFQNSAFLVCSSILWYILHCRWVLLEYVKNTMVQFDAGLRNKKSDGAVRCCDVSYDRLGNGFPLNAFCSRGVQIPGSKTTQHTAEASYDRGAP